MQIHNTTRDNTNKTLWQQSQHVTKTKQLPCAFHITNHYRTWSKPSKTTKPQN